MQLTVLGATGMIGSRIADQLEQRGDQVTRASRSQGIDAWNTSRLMSVFEENSTVVDCLNLETLQTKEARAFFTGTARNIIHAAESTGVSRIVCVSIAGASDPRVNRRLGYYQAKSAQEQTYQRAIVPSTIVHSTQWFELIDTIASRASVGPITVLPTMKIAALAVDRAAAIIVDQIEHSAESAEDLTLSLRGPEEATMLQYAQAILAARGSIGGKQPRVMTQLPLFGRAVAKGGLIPVNADVTDGLTLQRWLASEK